MNKIIIDNLKEYPIFKGYQVYHYTRTHQNFIKIYYLLSSPRIHPFYHLSQSFHSIHHLYLLHLYQSYSSLNLSLIHFPLSIFYFNLCFQIFLNLHFQMDFIHFIIRIVIMMNLYAYSFREMI